MSTEPDSPTAIFELLDWKRTMFALYAAVRGAAAPETGWRLWRETRDSLFRTHPQSPLEEQARKSFAGVPYFDFDPGLRVSATIEPLPSEGVRIGSSGTEAIAFERFGAAHFSLDGADLALELYWLTAYGGGVFVPFRDATSGSETYGGGRYLLDTVKGADLGMDGDRLVLDFNFAYNPSCSYDPRWICPLSPPVNRLPVAIHGGERYRGV
ncbi:MAG TPA: DUF1684 domain-containing protein [Gaiellaceae bacterium]